MQNSSQTNRLVGAMSGMSAVKYMKAVIKDSHHSSRLALSFHKFGVQNDFTDVCFICDKGYKVFAHKLIFCAVSQQLTQMFLGLPQILPVVTIHLPDVQARLLRLVCDFLYEGRLQIHGADYLSFIGIIDMLGINIPLEVQPGPQMVTTQVQENNSQVAPRSSQVVADRQVAGAHHTPQQANQVIVKKIRQSNLSPNQPIQQGPQYVMSSNSNQLTTSKAPRQYKKKRPNVNNITPSTSSVGNNSLQSQRPQKLQETTQSGKLADNEAVISEEDIAEWLGDTDFNTLTAKELREKLEKKLGVDLSSQESLIDEVLKSIQELEGTVSAMPETLTNNGATGENVGPSNVNSKPMKRTSLSKSDDESDEDLCPKKKVKRKYNKKK